MPFKARPLALRVGEHREVRSLVRRSLKALQDRGTEWIREIKTQPTQNVIPAAAQQSRQKVGLISQLASGLLNVRARLLRDIARQRCLVEHDRDRSPRESALLRDISQRCTSTVFFA